MASTPTSPCEKDSVEKHLTCSICMDMFSDPVTTPCGHSFCKECLDRCLKLNVSACPLCKCYFNKTPEVNIVLRSVVEQVKRTLEKNKDAFTGAAGEVACDICTGQRLKAKKSCLVCLASYCAVHLGNHSTNERFKGHKLVEPVENLDERACLTHGRPLELYNRKRQRCVCVLCMEEGEEGVVSTEDEWDKKKAELENTKAELQQKIKKRKTKVDEIDASAKSCKDTLDTEWQDIEDVFTAVGAMVEAAQAEALQPLQDRSREVEKEAEELREKLNAEIDQLEKTITELEDISAYEDHILFLQRYPSLREPDDMTDWTNMNLDTSLTFGTMRKITTTMMEQIQQELEKLTSIEMKRVPKFGVDVKFDRSTAHRRLVLSDDGKEVKDGGEDQEVDDGPGRFDLFGSVLGLSGLTSGKSYWEVEVRNKAGWDLGVARGDVDRKGKLTLNPDHGFWVTVHYDDDKYAALTIPPAHLVLKEPPKKVGVFVDYEEGLVSFYNVEAQSHIFSFTDGSFGDKLLPYFSPHVKDEKNADPLILTNDDKKVEDEFRLKSDDGSIFNIHVLDMKMCWAAFFNSADDERYKGYIQTAGRNAQFGFFG